MSAAKKATQQQTLNHQIERIKQYPGQQQVDRAVKVDVPGKHFPRLPPLPPSSHHPASDARGCLVL